MPLSYDIRSDGTLVITGSGALTSADLASLREGWADDPRLAEVTATLVDLRNVSSWEVSGETMRHYATSRAQDTHLRRPDSRLAIVATSNVGFGLARLYEQSGEVYGRIEVFRTLEDAEAWLADEG
jgi:hypothetical protein